MDKQYKFQVTEDGLHHEADLKWLKVTNGIYDVIIFYYGDYDSDKLSGRIDRMLTMVDVKHDGLRPDIAYMAGYLCVKIPLGEMIPLHRVEEYVANFKIAKDSAFALCDLLKEYGFSAEIK